MEDKSASLNRQLWHDQCFEMAGQEEKLCRTKPTAKWDNKLLMAQAEPFQEREDGLLRMVLDLAAGERRLQFGCIRAGQQTLALHSLTVSHYAQSV